MTVTAPPAGALRVVILGNAGSGKSTLARRMAAEAGLESLDLDTVYWEPGQLAVARPSAKVLEDLARYCDSRAQWVIEGCYGDLVRFLLRWQPRLILLDPGTQTCLRHCRERPWEPHKYASKREQDAQLDNLLAWVAGYDEREDDISRAGHEALYAAYTGPKERRPGCVVYHIPVCPFSQRLEILLALKGRREDTRFHVVDITRPRAPWLLTKSRGTTALPIMEIAEGRVLKESLVILQYLDDIHPECPIAQRDPYRRAVENMLTRIEGEFANCGYGYVLNQDPSRRDALRAAMLAQYARLNDFLVEHAPTGAFLFEDFGWAEVVFTPLFMRFWFLSYYEGFHLPRDERYARVRRWRDACLAHPAAQQVTKEQIVKLYYDYAKGAGNGALLPGRQRSSFVFEPDWRQRPWPPADKYGHSATDAELGL